MSESPIWVDEKSQAALAALLQQLEKVITMASYIVSLEDGSMEGGEIADIDTALAQAQAASENDGKTRTVWETRAVKKVVAEPVQKYAVHIEDVA